MTTAATKMQVLNFVRKSDGVVEVLDDRSTVSFGTIELHKMGTRTMTCFLTKVSGLSGSEIGEINRVMSGLEADIELSDILA